MRYRVIQWSTGAMGKTCLRAVIDHPDMELAGVLVYSDAKAGQDAGEIARRAPTGVLATRSVEDILALKADVVIHAGLLQPPYGAHDDDIVRLLESGKNVISINGYSHPRHWGGARLARLEAACAKGGVSLMGAGLNPGTIGEKIAITATSMCSEVQRVQVAEVVDCSIMRNPDYVFRILGFGADPKSVNPNDPAWGPASALNGMYTEVLAAMASHLGWTLDAVETEHELGPATEELVVSAGTIAKGKVSALIWRWHGMLAGRRALTMTITWTMNPIAEGTPLWTVHIEGSPGVRIAVHLDRPADAKFRTTAEQLGLAGAVVNAIPVVCAAPPGVLTMPVSTPFRASQGRQA